jgi:3-hydroxyisobutyrate dehydrogenase-like beta-hydroxyacid dehydrogenase
MSETIGFIGAGMMGEPMARNLLRAGFAVRIFNRTRDKAQKLANEGAELAQTPADVTVPNGIVVTMLANDQAVEEVAFGPNGFGPRLRDGIHLSMSTISPATAERLAAKHREHGGHYVAAPVFGRPDAAAAKRLWICTSGNGAAKERVKPVLDALGQGVFDFGEKPGAANVIKVSGNYMILAATQAMAEAFTLAEKNGIARTDVANLFGKTLFACPVYQAYGKFVAEKNYEPPRFKLALGLKDISLMVDTGKASEVPMPLADLLQQRMLAAVAKGRGNLDWSAIALSVSEEAGLK